MTPLICWMFLNVSPPVQPPTPPDVDQPSRKTVSVRSQNSPLYQSRGGSAAVNEKLIRISYPVADLIVPLDRESTPIFGVLYSEMRRKNQILTIHPVRSKEGQLHLQCRWSDPKNAKSSSQIVLAQWRTTGVFGGGPRRGEEMLMKLICRYVEPDSWNSRGGRITLQYFPLGMALVINQTPENHRKIAEFLSALRRFQQQRTQTYQMQMAFIELDAQSQEKTLACPRVSVVQKRTFTFAVTNPLRLTTGTIHDVTQPRKNIVRAEMRWTPNSQTLDGPAPVGLVVKGKVTPTTKGQVRVDLVITQNGVERANKSGILVAGNIYRLVQSGRLDKKWKVVLQTDKDGTTTKWLNIVVTKLDEEEEEIKLKTVPTRNNRSKTESSLRWTPQGTLVIMPRLGAYGLRDSNGKVILTALPTTTDTLRPHVGRDVRLYGTPVITPYSQETPVPHLRVRMIDLRNNR